MGTAVGTVLADLASGALLALIFGTGVLGYVGLIAQGQRY
jgi:hypothetical protein